MKLYFCEKPSQAKDLAPFVGARTRGNGCYTGEGVTVTHGIGHLLEQAKPEHYNPALASWDINLLPVIPVTWAMQIKPDVRAQYNVVTRCLKEATEVVIATDADREGEVIAREVMQLAGYRGPVSRLWLSAMDPASVRQALGKLLPDSKTLPLYFSGLGRSRADWLGGMNVTMALTKAFGAGGKGGTLHFGRVQTPVLALVARRERAIRQFVPKTYYELKSVFELAGAAVPMAWLTPPALLDRDGHAIDRAAVAAVADKVRQQVGRIERVETTPERQAAPLPYSLGSLQREASAKHGFKAQAVLDACQALYEKYKVTSYPRTDCEFLPTSMFQQAPGVLDAIATIDPSLRPLVGTARFKEPSRTFNDKKITAHHAIIPTAHSRLALNELSKIERTVYDMIRRRYLAQFLGDFEYLKTVIEVSCAGERFRATGKTPTVPGWHAAYAHEASPKALEREEGVDEVALPPVKQGQAAKNLSCDVDRKQTKPPKRYTEGTLLGAMESIDKEIEDERLKKIMRTKEKAGIGTDATRSTIIENLFKRDYIAADRKQITPTDKGEALITLLEQVAPELADPVLTAEWEDKLMQIEAGQYRLEQFEAELGTWLKALIERIKVQGRSAVTRIGTPAASNAAAHAAVPCPSCGKPMRRITGAKGPFWGCTGYADGCRTTLPDADGKPGQRTQSSGESNPLIRCAQCHKPLRRINGPKGFFWGCTGYVDGCRYTQPDDNGKPGVRVQDVAAKASATERHAAAAPLPQAGKLGEVCPACGKGHLVQRFSREGNKPFLGCTAFPICRYFKWA